MSHVQLSHGSVNENNEGQSMQHAMPMVMTEFSGYEGEVINMITETCSVYLVIYHLPSTNANAAR